MIKNIVFDMGNVILDYDPKRYLSSLFKDSKSAEAVLEALFYSPEWEDMDHGTATEERALSDIKARNPLYAAEIQTAMNHWHEGLIPIDGMVEIVKMLKEKGYKIYLLSNTSLRFFDYYKTIEAFNYFDGFLISAKEVLLKPDTAIYKRFLEMFSLKAEECFFTDDKSENVESAISIGLKGCTFTDAKSFLQELRKEKIV